MAYLNSFLAFFAFLNLLWPVLGHVASHEQSEAQRGGLHGLLCRKPHTSTCLHYTVTETKTAPARATKTVTVTKKSTCPTTKPSAPVPTDACPVKDESTCPPSGWNVDYYANQFFGYGFFASNIGPNYYIMDGQMPLASSTTNSTYFPQDMPNFSFYRKVFPNATEPDQPYFIGYKRHIDGITVDANNYTLVYSGLYKAPATGVYQICAEADNLVETFFGAGSAYVCGGQPTADSQPANLGPAAAGGDFNNPTSCLNSTLTKDGYYPFRLVYGNFNGPSALGFTIQPPGGVQTHEFDGLVYPPSCAAKLMGSP